MSVDSLLLLISKTKTAILKKKRAVEAAKSIRLSSRRVEIPVSTLERFAHKDTACKTEVFLHTLFLENEVQIGNLQKMKIGTKSDIRPFCTKAFNYCFSRF